MARIAKRIRLRRELLRRRAKNDPNAFIEYCITDDTGAFLVQADIHRRIQAHLSDHDYAVVVIPREHGKTTQVVSRVLWELGNNPNLRIKILCASDELAKKRVRVLKRIIEHNPYVRDVFPHLRPANFDWTTKSFTVQRDSNVPDSSVESYGVTSSATGGRCDLLIQDDVCDAKNSLFSNARRHEVCEAIDNVWTNLVNPTHGRIWMIATPWHYDDATMRKSQSDSYALLHCGINANLDPIWPEKWGKEHLLKRKADIGSIAFARSFHCRPMSTEEQVFRPEWFRFYRPSDLPKDLVCYAGMDPAFSEKSKADECAFCVIGESDGKFFVLDAFGRRGLSIPEMVDITSGLGKKYNLARIGVEINQAQREVARAIKRQTNIAVRDITTTRDKYTRMSLLATHFENERVLLRANGNGVHKSQEALYDQLVQFGSADHDDLCDALDFAIQSAQVSRVQLLT